MPFITSLCTLHTAALQYCPTSLPRLLTGLAKPWQQPVHHALPPGSQALPEACECALLGRVCLPGNRLIRRRVILRPAPEGICCGSRLSIGLPAAQRGVKWVVKSAQRCGLVLPEACECALLGGVRLPSDRFVRRRVILCPAPEGVCCGSRLRTGLSAKSFVSREVISCSMVLSDLPRRV